MQPFASAPRLLVILLALLVAVLAAQALLFSSRPLLGLLWPALIGAISLSVLFGSRRAASVLKYILYFLSALPLLFAITGPMSAGALARSFGVAAFTLFVGLYLARSKEVVRFLSATQAEA
jgi:hypothetical protein